MIVFSPFDCRFHLFFLFPDRTEQAVYFGQARVLFCFGFLVNCRDILDSAPRKTSLLR